MGPPFSLEATMPRRERDKNLFVKFESRAVLNEIKSYGAEIRNNDGELIETIKGADRPIVDNVDYVHIEIPGDRGCIAERPVTACDKKLLATGVDLSRFQTCRARKGLDDQPMVDECDVHRFFDEYAAFKSGQEAAPDGTALKAWPGIDRASVEELAYFKVYTVEQLAGMNDSNAMPFIQLRERARDYLKKAKDGNDAGLLRRIQELEAKLAAKEKRP